MHPAFRVHMLNDKGKAAATEIAAAFDELAARLFLAVPQGRELSIVMTKLEEAWFFAKKGIANVDANLADPSTTIVDRPIPLPPRSEGLTAPAGAVLPVEQLAQVGAGDAGKTGATSPAAEVVDAKATRPARDFSGPGNPRPAAQPRTSPKLGPDFKPIDEKN